MFDFIPQIYLAEILLLLIMSFLTVICGVTFLWTYRKYPFTPILGNTVACFIAPIYFLFLIPLYTVPNQSYFPITQIFHRIGAIFGFGCILLFLISNFLLSSYEVTQLSLIPLIITSLIFGFTMAVFLGGGIYHVLLPNGMRTAQYTPECILFSSLSLFASFTFVYKIVRQIRSARQRIQANNEYERFLPPRNVGTTFLILVLIFVSFATLILSRFESIHFPTQTWLIGLFLAITVIVGKFSRDPSVIIRTYVQLYAFLVIAPNGTPYYIYNFKTLRSESAESIDAINIVGIISALQSFLKIMVGGGEFRYLFAEQSTISIEQEMGFVFCLVTDRMNLLVSETNRAIKTRFIKRFKTSLDLFQEHQPSNLSFFKTFDNEIALFSKFFL
ncbi:MAG: hypothetical protein ACFFBD_02000 [Candidatus Hodarchaeota archaeon]